MSANDLLRWMDESAISHWIVDKPWVFPTLETLHFLGLILLLGSLLVVDLRFAGVASRIPLRSIVALLPVSMVGFAINLSTGLLFLFADPFRYYPNPAFRLKMLAVLLAGLNALWFKFSLDWQNLPAEPGVNPGTGLRWVAAISLLLWTSVVVLGRMIPYVE